MLLIDQIEAAIKQRPFRMTALFGGSTGAVHKIELPNGTNLVAKSANPHCRLEARMLAHLAATDILPIPAIHYVDDGLLIMDHHPNDDIITNSVQIDLGRMLAKLHDIEQPYFGFEEDTTIGALTQVNPPADDWLTFFGEHRLRHRALIALDKGRLAPSLMPRIERLIQYLPDFIDPDIKPGLLHGDLWAGNLLTWQGKVSGIIDPAVYYGAPEMELAYLPLFGGFDQTIYDSYHQHRAIDGVFYSHRQYLYQLWPLLVHVELFAGSYNESVDSHLLKLGF